MREPVRILHLVHQLTVGGAERILADIVNRSGPCLEHVICSFATPDDFADSILESTPVLTLDKQAGNDLSIPARIAGFCRTYKVDLIHSIGWSTYLDGFLGALLQMRRRPKFVYAFHGKTISDLKGIPSRRVWAQRLLSYGCNGIIAPSLEMKNDYAHTFHVDHRKISLIYNGVDTDKFYPCDSAAEAKNQFGFTADTMVLGCVARLDPVKNLPGLIRSFARIYQDNQKLRLMIVGGGPQERELSELIDSLSLTGKIVLTGVRSDVDFCYRAMDIYVQPSFYEGFSVTLLEAMASGLPIVAGNVGGTPEMVRHNVNGLLFDVGDDIETHLAQALAHLTSDEQFIQRAGEDSRKIVEDRFSLKIMIRNYEDFFMSVVTGKLKGQR